MTTVLAAFGKINRNMESVSKGAVKKIFLKFTETTKYNTKNPLALLQRVLF